MKKPQIDKLSNYQTLKLVLEDPAHKPVWTTHPAFLRGAERFYGSINVLAALAQAQGTPITGIAVDKDRLAESLIARTLVVSGAIAAWASETDNRTLFDRADVKEGELQKLRDAELDDAAQVQHDLALDNLAVMPDYGLTNALLADLQSAITAYTPLVGKAYAERSKRKSVTDAIPDEFARADKILDEQLDRLVRQFETDHKSFVDAYRNARRIVQSGGGSRGEDEGETDPATPGVPTP